MSRLQNALDQVRARGTVGLVPYFPVGFPHLDSAVTLIRTAANAGVTAIELGVPFSDPLADGQTVQRATAKALANGVTLATCLETVRQARAEGVVVPLILMGYYNPMFHFGLERFAEEAAAAGVDGLIVPDLPAEEAGPLLAACQKRGIALIPMVAPTSTDDRIRESVAQAGGFVYCVSLTGVTGSRRELPASLPAFVARIKRLTNLPVGVGFGVSSREHVEQVGQLAELAIVGSAVVERIEGKTTEAAAHDLGIYLRELTGGGT